MLPYQYYCSRKAAYSPRVGAEEPGRRCDAAVIIQAGWRRLVAHWAACRRTTVFLAFENKDPADFLGATRVDWATPRSRCAPPPPSAAHPPVLTTSMSLCRSLRLQFSMPKVRKPSRGFTDASRAPTFGVGELTARLVWREEI